MFGTVDPWIHTELLNSHEADGKTLKSLVDDVCIGEANAQSAKIKNKLVNHATKIRPSALGQQFS